VLPGDAQIPQVVSKVVLAGVDRHGCERVGMQQACRVIGRCRRYSRRGRETGLSRQVAQNSYEVVRTLEHSYLENALFWTRLTS
jgi:hypothetical protein